MQASRNHSQAEETLKEHQRNLARFEASANGDAALGPKAALQSMIDQLQEQRDTFAYDMQSAESRVLDLTSQITHGATALEELYNNLNKSATNTASFTSTTYQDPAQPAADDWTVATSKQYAPGTYPPSAPSWLTNELSELRASLHGAKKINDELQKDLRAAQEELRILRHEQSRRPGGGTGGRTFYYAPTPGSGSHGSHRGGGGGDSTQYGGWAENSDGATTPKVNIQEDTWGTTGNDSAWGKSPAAAASDSWDTPASATNQAAGAASSDDPWGQPASVALKSGWSPSAMAAAPSQATTANATLTGSGSDKGSTAPHDPTNPARHQSHQVQPLARSNSSSKRRSSGAYSKKVESIDMAALDSQNGFSGNQAQLIAVRDIARKVANVEIENFQQSYIAPLDERRKHQIKELERKFGDLRFRTLTIEDRLGLEHPTDPGLAPDAAAAGAPDSAHAAHHPQRQASRPTSPARESTRAAAPAQAHTADVDM